MKCIPANWKYSVISSGFPSMVDNQLTAAVEPIAKSLNPVISLGSARQMTMQGKYHVSRYALISPNTSWKSTAVAACWCRGSRWLPRWTIQTSQSLWNGLLFISAYASAVSNRQYKPTSNSGSASTNSLSGVISEGNHEGSLL